MYPINSVLNTAVLEVSVAGKPTDQLLLDIYLSVRDEHKGKRMWREIANIYTFNTGEKVSIAALQMRMTRIIRKVIWPQSEVRYSSPCDERTY